MNITITENELHYFWVTAYHNFYPEQSERFDIIKESVRKGDLTVKNKKKATMYFCENYLNAKIIQSFFRRKKVKAIIVLDRVEENPDDFVVIVGEELKFT